jgi:predicted  nucleic acid-binding Zn-ribbon protein
LPHQCVRCGKVYGDADRQVLTGCVCGAKLFFYVKKEALERAKQVHKELSEEDKKQITKDVFDIVVGENIETEEIDQPIVLDFESINVKSPGKYEIDLVHLFSGQPLIYKVEDGKYIIDIPSTLQMSKNDPEKANKKKK